MPCQGYSRSHIEFIPYDNKQKRRDYSERSLIELHALDDGKFFVRGIDVENKKAEIFNIRLKNDLTYKFASSQNNYDEIHSNDGMYRLLLNPDSRNTFHKDLRQALAELALLDGNSLDNVPERNQSSGKPEIPTQIKDEENILVNMRQLCGYLKSGNQKDAADLAIRLARQNVQVKLEELNKDTEDKKFSIRVKIDGIDIPSRNADEVCSVNVYSSTTIQELRLVFEHVCGYPSEDQYFFVDGHLAYGESTMEELKVEDGRVFVLFLTSKYPENNNRQSQKF